MNRSDEQTSDQEAIALARCYRLLIEKAAEHRQHSGKDCDATLALDSDLDKQGVKVQTSQETIATGRQHASGRQI